MPYISEKMIPSAEKCEGYSFDPAECGFGDEAPEVLSCGTSGSLYEKQGGKAIADIFRSYFGSHPDRLDNLAGNRKKVALDIMRCGTGELGYNSTVCPDCGKVSIHANSCGNSYCPCCKGSHQLKWIEARKSELVEGIPYFHLVFTVPSELEPLAGSNPEDFYGILFSSASETLLKLSRQGEKEVMKKTAEINACRNARMEPESFIGPASDGEDAYPCMRQDTGMERDNRVREEAGVGNTAAPVPKPLEKKDKKHRTFVGGIPGFVLVLHSWGASMLRHSHLHCLLAGGALLPDRSAFLRMEGDYLIPTGVLKAVFRGIFMKKLDALYREHALVIPEKMKGIKDVREWNRLKTRIREKKGFNVFIKETFNGKGNAVEYLARYVGKACISNARIVSHTETEVTFKYKDYKNGSKIREMKVTVEDFVERFLSHVLTQGFHRVRYGGFLANGVRRKNLEVISRLAKSPFRYRTIREITTAEVILEKYGKDIDECPCCSGRNLTRYIFPAGVKLIQVRMVSARELYKTRTLTIKLSAGAPPPKMKCVPLNQMTVQAV